MNELLSSILPSATNMIRLDHTHVMSTFHQFKPSAPARVQQGLANTICTALEVHAQLEEEIFYPAVRHVLQDKTIDESETEHQEMKRLIAKLRGLQPDDPAFAETLYELMRDVLHHVADEETIVLPAAERQMPEQLGELGARMTRRRLELVVPRTGELALDMGRAASGNTVAMAVVAASAMGLVWAMRGRRPQGDLASAASAATSAWRRAQR